MIPRSGSGRTTGAGFNTTMWYNPGVLDLHEQYGLKQLMQVEPHHLQENESLDQH